MFPNISFSLQAALAAVRNVAIGASRYVTEKVGRRVKGKNRRLVRRPNRTSTEMLRKRACNVRMSEDGKSMRFVRGKLIGGQPRLWRP